MATQETWDMGTLNASAMEGKDDGLLVTSGEGVLEFHKEFSDVYF